MKWNISLRAEEFSISQQKKSREIKFFSDNTSCNIIPFVETIILFSWLTSLEENLPLNSDYARSRLSDQFREATL